MIPSREQKLWMYEKMVISRRFEEAIAAIYFEGKKPVFNMANGPIPGEMHLSDGQEPCAVGVCAHLQPYDIVTATHRPHHQAIAKGVDLKRMAAEIFGKATGLSGGRGGHMHLFDSAVNFACSGIIAQGMGPAVGAALLAKCRASQVSRSPISAKALPIRALFMKASTWRRFGSFRLLHHRRQRMGHIGSKGGLDRSA